MKLTESLQNLISTFVEDLVGIIRGAPINELLGTGNVPVRAPAKVHAARPAGKAPAPATTSTGRLKRRTAEEIGEVVASVVGLLKKHPMGMRSEQIKLELGLDVREVPRVLKEGLSTREIKVLSGHKRSTIYGLPGSLAAKRSRTLGDKQAGKKTKKATPKKSAKKTAPKKATKKAAKHAAPKKSSAKKSSPKKAKRSAPKKSSPKKPKRVADSVPTATAPPIAAE